jgi:predicted O-methyltransferase YrrM
MTNPLPARDVGPDAAAFDHVWKAVAPFGGWLSRDQGALLWSLAAALRADGQVVEIGSHQGKSTAVLAGALVPTARLTAIDPFDPQFELGQAHARQAFERNLEGLGLRDRVDLQVALSQDVLPGWRVPIDLLYIDGAHDPASVRRDLGWLAHVRAGAPVLMHDAFSSVGVTLLLYGQIMPGRRLRYVGRSGSMALFHRQPPTTASRWAMVAELPWFLRNVAVKVARRLRLMPVARMLGHDDPRYDPF